MRRTLLLAAAMSAVCAASARAGGFWRGLDEASHYSGPALTEEDLAGKVVLVDEWGVNCPPCRALLPRMQAIWSSFKSKPFVLLGSHRQGLAKDRVAELVAANKLTYPIYERAGLAAGEPPNGGGIPFLYVVNHRGKVVYSGRDEREATEAVVNAIGAVGAPLSLTGGVVLRGKYKPLEKKLVLGKAIRNDVKALEAAVKKGGAKTATKAQLDDAETAAEILKAIEAAKDEARAEIEVQRASDPAAAVKTIKAFMTTFPEEGAQYRDQLAELAERARAQKPAK